MTDLPPLTLVMTTYATDTDEGRVRRDEAAATLQSWVANLFYDGPLRLHIADDGSDLPGYPQDLRLVWGVAAQIELVSFSRQERRGVGASLNAGMRETYLRGPVWFYGVDDWVMTQPVDLTPWVRLLLEDREYGIVRLFPHPNLRGTIAHRQGHEVEHVLRLDRYSYAFATRPMLVHQRFTGYYGDFAEGVSAYDVEDQMRDRFNADPNGPDIALALPTWFRHESSVEQAGIVPGGE